MSERYAKYLASKHWLRTRINKLLSVDVREHPPRVQCERCGLWLTFTVCRGTKPGLITPGMAFHHKTYERIGRERLSDLEILCDGCHARCHGYEPPLWWLEARQEQERFGEFTVTREYIRARPKLTRGLKLATDAITEIDRRLGELDRESPLEA